jgi:hypothetical protein
MRLGENVFEALILLKDWYDVKKIGFKTSPECTHLIEKKLL